MLVYDDNKYVSAPIVSVIIITYNQQLYIEECINSIIGQICDFKWELIIADDCSVDNTQSICEFYQQKYPEAIKLLLQEENQGLIRNYRDALNLCRGKYIAQCAGDDYWCDKYKLQKQYDCLESKPGYGFVRTSGWSLLKDGTLKDATGFHNMSEGDVFHLAMYGPLGMAASIFFESRLLSYIDFDEFLKRGFSMEDYPMHAIFAKHTKFATIIDKCVVYRQLNESISQSKEYNRRINYMKGKNSVCMYLNELYPDECHFDFDILEDTLSYMKLKYAFEEFNYTQAKEIRKIFISNLYRNKYLYRMSCNIILFIIFGVLYKLKKYE